MIWIDKVDVSPAFEVKKQRSTAIGRSLGILNL